MRTSAPNIIWLTEGTAEGDSTLNAFDNALLIAGIGNWNLVKVTSVAPRGAELIHEPVEIEAGSIVPVVLSEARSNCRGEVITACLGIGLGRDSHGMIMEHAGPGTPGDMEPVVHRMVEESFARRGLELDRVVVRSVCHEVAHIGACVAAAVLWWR